MFEAFLSVVDAIGLAEKSAQKVLDKHSARCIKKINSGIKKAAKKGDRCFWYQKNLNVGKSNLELLTNRLNKHFNNLGFDTSLRVHPPTLYISCVSSPAIAGWISWDILKPKDPPQEVK